MIAAWRRKSFWLFSLLFVIVMATGTQQQQQQQQQPSSESPPSPSPPLSAPSPPPTPADGLRGSSGESDSGHDQLVSMMRTLPSEGLVLATGETAILECRISTAAGSNKDLSWTNTMTNAKVTNNSTAFQNTSLIYEPSVDSNETTSLVLIISNLTDSESEFRCELDVDQYTQQRRIQRTVKVSVLSSDWFCTFEGETTCAWKIGNAWTREHWTRSSFATNDPASCTAPFPDHTYGKDNVNGHFLVARVTGDRQIEGATLNETVRNTTECIRFYYRTCVMNNSRGDIGLQMMLTTKSGVSSSSLLINLSLALDWTEYSLTLLQQNQEQYEIIMSFTYTNASDFAYFAIDDIQMEDNSCESANQPVTKTESTSESRALLPTPTSIITTTTVLKTTTSGQSSASKTASTSMSATKATTQPTSSSSSTPTTSPSTTAPTKASSSSLHPTDAIQLPLLTTSVLVTPKRTPDESEDSIRPTDDDRSTTTAVAASVDEAEMEETNDDAAAAAAAAGDNSTGLAIGIILAIMVAGACTAAILYRRRKNGKKSTYITFGNPSYSREHLPVNDFGLDSPLTLSSNGYTVLA